MQHQAGECDARRAVCCVLPGTCRLVYGRRVFLLKPFCNQAFRSYCVPGQQISCPNCTRRHTSREHAYARFCSVQGSSPTQAL